MISPTHIAAKKRPSLKNLFPNGEESYLAVTVKLYEQDIIHIIICNDHLAEDPRIWKDTVALVEGTDFQFTLGTIKKEDFRVLKAADILNSQGDDSIVCAKTQKEYLDVMVGVIQQYNAVMAETSGVQQTDTLPTDLNPQLNDDKINWNTKCVTYTPQSNEEIEFMYQ